MNKNALLKKYNSEGNLFQHIPGKIEQNILSGRLNQSAQLPTIKEGRILRSEPLKTRSLSFRGLDSEVSKKLFDLLETISVENNDSSS